MRPNSFVKNSSYLRQDQGTTLVELAISSAILLFLSVAMLMVITSAIQYYHATNATIAAQQGVLLGLNRISAQLTESNLDGIQIIDQPTTPPKKGIVFPSARLPNNNYFFDSFGKLQWQQFICYRLQDVNDKGEFAGEKSALVKSSMALGALAAASGQADLSNLPPGVIPKILPSSAAVDALFSAPPDLVAGRYVSGFEAKFEQIGTQQVVTIKLTAETSYRNKFKVEAETSVMVRN